MVPNLMGIAFGYYYYWDVGQFNPASPFYEHWSLWWLVADSPNAVVLMSIALIGWHFGLRSRLVDGLAFLHMVYVGLWTTYLFLLYPERMGTFDWASFPGNANPMLFVSHMGMPLEALLLVPHLRKRGLGLPMLAGFVAWGLVFVSIDYWGPHLHPAPFIHANPEYALAWGSVALMVLSLLALAWASTRAKRAPRLRA